MIKPLYTLSELEVLALAALVERGPLLASELQSKSACAALQAHHWAVAIVVKAETGFIAATYEGMRMYCAYFDGATVEQAKANRLTKNYGEKDRQNN